jgi:hypothetical protein
MPPVRGRGAARAQFGAEPLYCQFDLPVRRRPIGSYEVFFVLCHLVPDNLNVRRASRARKLVLPKASGPESQRSVGANIFSFGGPWPNSHGEREIKRKVLQDLMRLNAHHRAIPQHPPNLWPLSLGETSTFGLGR